MRPKKKFLTIVGTVLVCLILTSATSAATVTIYADPGDGYITYNSGSGNYNVDSTSAEMSSGVAWNDITCGYYYLMRSFLRFNISRLSRRAWILAAKLYIYKTNDPGAGSFVCETNDFGTLDASDFNSPCVQDYGGVGSSGTGYKEIILDKQRLQDKIHAGAVWDAYMISWNGSCPCPYCLARYDSWNTADSANKPYLEIDYVADCGLRAYNGTHVIKIACEPVGTLTSPLRIHKNGTTYGIVLVDPSDPAASKIRIQTSSGIKALRKLD